MLGLLACKDQKSATTDTAPSKEEEVQKVWSERQDQEFLKNCNGFLENESVEGASTYCNCLLNATKKAHPDPETAMTLEQNDIVSLFEESGCLDDYLMVKIEDPWTDEVSAAFISQCETTQIEGGAEEAVAKAYCSCALDKIKELIPQPQHLVQLTEAELSGILEDCK